MNYQALADFSIQYGFWIASFVVCFGLAIVLGSIYFWVICLKDLLEKDENFPNKTFWLFALTLPAFSILFYGIGFFIMFIICLVYYFKFRPKLLNLRN